MNRKILYCLPVVFFLAARTFAQGKTEYLQWIEDAKKGDIEKQYLSGLAYYKGIGGASKDYKKAYQWFDYAAKNGSHAAYVSLGDMYLFGNLDSADEKKAFDYYLEAAKSGNSDGMERLGDMYLNSKSLGNNHFEAARWYEEAAKNTNMPGPYAKLARIYYAGGENFNRNEEKALEYFLKAFEFGDYEVAHYIAGIYEDRGKYEQAAQWLTTGAEKGSTISMYYLAKAYGRLRDYEDKNIINLDYVQSYKWLYLLTKKEYQKRYEEDIKTLERKMKKTEVKKARKYAETLEKRLISENEIKWSNYSKKHSSQMK